MHSRVPNQIIPWEVAHTTVVRLSNLLRLRELPCKIKSG